MGLSTSKRDWIMAAAGLLMIAVAVRIAVGSRSPAPAAAPPPSVRSEAAPVALYVQHDGDALRLHWNADSDAVRRASKGALLIADGPRQSRLDLGPAELHSGVASYWPESKGVDFKLELDGAVAGELQAPALEVREEPRPSPFYAEPKRKPAPARAAVVDADDEEPRPHTVRANETHHADRVVEKDEESPRKPSKWHRITGKIPLIRRLGKH